MQNQKYQPPKFLNIFIAFVIFIILLVLIFNLDSFIKQVGDVLLYIPSQLGSVQRVTSEEIKKVSISGTTVTITKPGKYFVFADFNSMFPIRLEKSDKTLVGIKSQTTGEHIKVFSIERGIRLYDTPLAKGRPISTFEITTPDKYEIAFYSISYYYGDTFAIVPDYSTGKEAIISFAYGIQIAILLTILGIIYYPYYQRSRERIKNIEATQKQMQIKGQAFWEAEMHKDKKKIQKDNE